MAKTINLTLDFEQDLQEVLQKEHPEVSDYRVLSQALDARGANRGKRPRYTYRLELIGPGEKFSAQREHFQNLGPLKNPPLIIGAGPAGLFCALRFAEYGIPSIVIERGDQAQNRMKHIGRFWRHGQFDSENNVCFGEGGAGLFSDGKLITRIKSPFVQYVMNRLVDFGAPPETAYMSNPHLGSNKIRLLIGKITGYLQSSGVEFRYRCRMDELLFEGKKVIGVKLADGTELQSDHVIMATGHSAKEVYYHLKNKNIEMKSKDFALGVRVEHPRKLIDQLQFGNFSGGALGASRYRLSYDNPIMQKGTYSFCMCPGGHVLSSGTDADGIVVNGMSNYARNSPWSNSALVVSVQAGVDFSADDVLAGHYFQRDIEKKAYAHSLERATGREVPAQSLKDFMEQKISTQLPKSSCPSGLVATDLDKILPAFVAQSLRAALLRFDQNIKGFISPQALFLAPETRTSAPVTIVRDFHSLQSTNTPGLYPCGEGAGYAGGITSAAVDGVKVAMAIIKKEKGPE